MAEVNLDQSRAAYAWRCVESVGDLGKYTNLAKSAPALIMNSGLMQTLAFYQEKGREHHLLLKHLREWLVSGQGKGSGVLASPADYISVMKALHGSDPQTYRLATREVMALLRWLRQFAAAAG